jgi:adenylosuccinate lyase
MEAAAVVKHEGKPNDLLDRIANDPMFSAIHSRLREMIDPIAFVGRAPQQVDEFLTEQVNPLLEANKELLDIKSVDGVNV